MGASLTGRAGSFGSGEPGYRPTKPPVSRESGNSSETVEAGEVVDESPQYQTGSSREYAFAMDVPEAAGPCLETEQTYVGWKLRAVMNRAMAFDPELLLWLNVYNGPTATAES
jgi:hypothetical protein